jgi:DNA-binding beta-propeller fold protein YncE
VAVTLRLVAVAGLLSGLVLALVGFGMVDLPGEQPRQGTAAPSAGGAPGTQTLRAVWRADSTGLETPVRICVSADGQVYVLDVGQDDGAAERVVVLGLVGEVVHRWTYDESEFNDGLQAEPGGGVSDPGGDWINFGPMDACGVEGDLVVLRSEDRIVTSMTYPGDTQLARHRGWSDERRWGNAVLRRSWYGDELYPYRVWPVGLSVSRSGEEVYVLDAGGPAIVAFDLVDGERKGRPEYLPPASADEADYEFDWYVDLDVLTDGRLAVLNQAGGELLLRRLRERGGRGPESSQMSLPGRPMRIAADGENNVLVLDASGFVRQMTPDGEVLAMFDARGPEPTVRTRISDLAVVPEGGVTGDGAPVPGGAVLVTDQESGDIYVYEPADKPAPEGEESEPHCRLEVAKEAALGRVAVGQEVGVRLEVTGDCPRRVGTDILLVIERDMVGGPSGSLEFGRSFARAFIEQAELSRDRIGIMTWGVRAGQQVQLDVPLTADRRALLEGLDDIGPVEDTFYGWYGARDPCLAMARAELGAWRARPEARQAVVLLADGLAGW